MSDAATKVVPRLVPQGFLPAPVLMEWRCLECDFVSRALSLEGTMAAMDAHVRYVNTQLDRTIDPHFREMRMDALIHG